MIDVYVGWGISRFHKKLKKKKNTQCGNLGIFLPLQFYVKSNFYPIYMYFGKGEIVPKVCTRCT